MSTKTKLPEYVEQAAELLKRIYDDRTPPTTFQERKKLTHWLHTLAERDAGIKYSEKYECTKAELLLKVHAAGVYVLPFTEAITKLYEEAKDRSAEATQPAAKPASRFTPTPAQKETAATLHRMYKAARTAENDVSGSVRNRTTRALKHLHRRLLDDVPERGFPAPADADTLYMEACRARAEGVQTTNLRGWLESVESVTYEARLEWERREEKAAAKPKPKTAVSGRAAATAPRGQRLYRIGVNDTLGCLGLVNGEEADVFEASDLKPGDAGAVEIKGEKRVLAGRVVSCDAEQVSIIHDDIDEPRSVPRADIVSVGRIDHLKPRKPDPLSKEDRRLVDTLLKKMERLNSEDDQIIRCTARYELEKQIYDIEHPTGGDPDDWSAWEVKDE